nr:MAG: hypothetical protein GM42_3500 [actinobacterium acMicro-1]
MKSQHVRGGSPNVKLSSGVIPDGFWGIRIVDPWIYPWFAVGAFALGIPATLNRPVGSWLAVLAGVAIVLGVAFILWLVGRGRISRLASSLIVSGLVVAILVAGWVVKVLNPIDSYVNPTDSSVVPDITPSTFVFLTGVLWIVWLLLWALVALLIAGQRVFRRTRRSLRRTLTRLDSLSTRFADEVLIPARALEQSVANQMNASAKELESLVSGRKKISFESASARIAAIKETFVPALGKIPQFVEQSDRIVPKKNRRVSLRGIPRRWNGRYFSGSVGALIIGIAAVSGSASTNFSSPGFLIQIPLILIAFYVSVPAALLLFFAAALTPFLGPNSAAAENFVLFVVIFLLGLLSFIHRANEVRQLRVVEGLSMANNRIARDVVRFRQQSEAIQNRLISVLHGSVQATVVAAEVQLGKKAVPVRSSVLIVADALKQAADTLTRVEDAPEFDFKQQAAAVIALWDGSISLSIEVSPEAERALSEDNFAAGIAMEVINEGTVNAAKHAQTQKVRAQVGLEGSRLRVTVTNPRGPGEPTSRSSGNIGLTFLRQMTTDLRLEVTDKRTTLFAEIPARVTTRGEGDDAPNLDEWAA